MKKSTRQLLVVTIFFIILFLIFVYFFFLIKKNQKITDTSTDEINFKKEQPSDEYIHFAQKILDHLESQKDDYGFYGGMRQCYNLNNQKCDWQLNNVIKKLIETKDKNLIAAYASQRYTIPVIWARYRNYLKTKDSNQLQLVYNDLDNLIKQVIENDDLDMQTHSFNCLLLEELIHSPHLDDQYRQKVKQICDNNYFEIHPQSLVFYSQNKRTPLIFLKFAQLPEDIENNNFVRPESANDVTDDQRIFFEKNILIQEINQLIEKINQNQTLSEQELKNIIALVNREKFITRENFAILDRAAAMRIDDYFNQDNNRNLLDYLILMKEVLNYYLLQQHYSALDKCLLYENIKYYKNHFNQTLNIEPLKSKLDANFFSRELLPCFVVKDLLNDEVQDPSEVYKQVQQSNNHYGNELNSFWPGYVYSTKDELNYDDPFGNLYVNVETNALLAGLLLK